MSAAAADRKMWSERSRALTDTAMKPADGGLRVIRSEIQDSWRRCQMTGITPGTDDIPFTQDVPEASRLRRAADPILANLAGKLTDSPATILLADSAARIVDRRAGAPELRGRLDAASVAPGFMYAEEATGTNGIGTALEERRLFSVRGGEHFRESLQNLACVGKPIIHPISRNVEGILDITCAVSEANALMEPLVEAAVREIEQRLYELASQDERALLEEFLRTSRRGGSAVITLSNDLVMANPAASRLLQPADQALLWNWACLRLGTRDEFIGELQLASSREVLAKVRRLEDGRRTMGIVVEMRPKPDGKPLRRTSARARQQRKVVALAAVPPLPGRSKATRRLDGELDVAAHDPGPALITGEHGVGKRFAARRLHQRWSPEGQAGQLCEYDLAMVEATQARSLVTEIRDHLTADATVVLRHIDAVPDAAMTVLVGLIEQANESAWRLIVTGADVPQGAALRAYAHFKRRIGVSPLAQRTDEIEDLAVEILSRKAPGRSAQRLQTATLQTLMARAWPGNVRELESVIESAAARALGGDIGLQHLPPGYREVTTTKARSAMERAELDALMTALEEAGGNKSVAAQRLGIARSTLYRKAREYGIDTDRFVTPAAPAQ
ncbi:sigma-54-dependent Fis family transcriptional regulator [Kribbia dieselivorans]|uniref:sigma-54-dependent Fis family transcriptional regulator n=1 Tax=Kribbia dieselivorans TaxID=331526 RepID=UPI0009F817E8|nr:helix-turn-helix domain-containing protein [Kribbia dieselivorans]